MFANLINRYRHVNWAMADQALVSAVNFATALILARLLGIEEFGRFSLIWLVFLLVNCLQMSLITFPMMSIAPKIEEDEQPAYYGACLIWQGGLIGLIAILLFLTHLACLQFYPDWHTETFVVATIAVTATFQVQEFMRRYFFVRNKPHAAFINDAISYIGQVIGLIIIFCMMNTKPNSSDALMVIAVTSLIAGVIGWLMMGHIELRKNNLKSTLKRHWHFGSWMALSQVSHLIGSQGVLAIAGGSLGLAAVGGIKAIINLLGPLNVIIQGIQNVVPIHSSRLLKEKGHGRMVAYLVKFAIVLAIAMTGLSALIAIFRNELVYLIYQEEYMSYADFTLWQCAVTVVFGLVQVANIYYRTIEKTRVYGVCMMVSSAIAVAVVFFGMTPLAETAVFVGLLAQQIILFGLLVGIYFKGKQKHLKELSGEA